MVLTYILWFTGVILVAVWWVRLIDAALGMPQVADVSEAKWRPPAGTLMPPVSVIVPARNEEKDIAQCIQTLLALDYPNFKVIAVDDRSTDRTGEILDRIAATNAGLRVIHVDHLPSGWMGKVHAMWLASKEATGEWLLFTDADVIFKPESLRRAVGYAQRVCADHLVLFPRMIMKGIGERMMIAFFQTLFLFGHRPWKTSDPKSADHMGVGAFNLVRRNVYEAIGTYHALRLEVLDDMKLGKMIKNAGYAQRNVYGKDLISIRWAKGPFGVIRNLTKNSFAILSFQWGRVLLSCFALAFLNVFPFLGIWLAHGWAKLPFVVALAGVFCVYLGMSWHSDVPARYFVLHPVSSAIFVYIMLSSMVLTLTRGGIVWRGTFYPLAELKDGMV